MNDRPLGHLSDFVVMTMPKAFAEGSLGSSLVHLELVSELDHLTEGELLLAALDAKMLEKVARMAGCCPEWLSRLVDELSRRTNTLPILNYHEIVEVNPLARDPRLFAMGEVGAAEVFFYEEHAASEEALVRLLVAAQHARLAMRQGVLVEAQRALLEIADCLEKMVVHMRRLLADPALKLHFDDLRVFWFSARPEVRDGPSGLSSSRIALMDLACTAVGDEYCAALRQRELTMDPGFRAEVRQAMEKREENLHTIWSALTETERRALAPALHRVATGLIDWRSRHVGAVARLAPAALKPGGVGTGGENQIRALFERRAQPAKDLAADTACYLGA